ncbi:MAG TPA: hypothetical protein VGK99_03825 [Acidobacteriota bacterium]
MRTRLFKLCAIPILLAFYTTTLSVDGCGPFYTDVIFTYRLHPDFPLGRFIDGRLGVVQSTYARSYLMVAYRHLIGKRFDADEKRALLSYYRDKLNFRGELVSPGLKAWLAVRAEAAPVNSDFDVGSVYRPGDYMFYLNCPDDAFRTAIQTLEQRRRKFGAKSLEFREWLAAQDKVFHNCPGYEAIPGPADPKLDSLISADREYQIATAHFYAGRFDTAAKIFTRISQDRSSPWRTLAPYLVARVLVRKATLGDKKWELAALQKAELQLNSVLADKTLNRMHRNARRLKRFVEFRLNPIKRFQDTARILAAGSPNPDIGADLADYTGLLDKYFEAKWQILEPAIKKDAMTDWILTFQRSGNEALQHSLRMWTRTRSLPWLLASLAKIDFGNPEVTKLLEAVSSVAPSSPAFASIAFHSLRLKADMGREDEARAQLDEMLDNSNGNLPRSSKNLLLALRMKLARNLDEFVKYAQRNPVLVSADNPVELPDFYPGAKIQDNGPYLDVDSARALTEWMPLSALKVVVKNASLGSRIRKELAQAVWVRSILLDDWQSATEVTPVLKALALELQEDLDQFMMEKDQEAMKADAVLTILRFPGMRPYVGSGLDRASTLGRIDNLRENWWCRLRHRDQIKPDEADFFDHYQRRTQSNGPVEILYPPGRPGPPLFLSTHEKEEAEREWKKLSSLPTAPNYLCSHVIAWARKNARDPRVPEALHRAIKTTRYGCTDAKTSELSRAAFDLLHSRYPASPWTKMTPYWFGRHR